MTAPGFFELYPEARPALPAGAYTATSRQALVAQTPHDGDAAVPVPDTEFHLTIVAPRYAMPPEQILSTFPPATSQGDWRERLPQIVLRRRTLPWERNPTANPVQPDHQAPPWLALVVLAEGEGRLSPDVDVSQCVTSGVDLGAEADVPRGKYLEVSPDVVAKVFPCLDELALLCHVRKVDLADTELALGDDDGYLSVVLSNRLPQPAAPKTAHADAQPLKYTACLINLEHQLDKLLPTEPSPELFFNSLNATEYVNADFLRPAPNATLDQIAMGIGPGATGAVPAEAAGAAGPMSAAQAARQASDVISYGTGRGLETAASSWATGPARSGAATADDLAIAGGYKAGVNLGVLVSAATVCRFPVLVSWDFTCTGEGGFERLMNHLDVGLLGTVDAAAPVPGLEVASTGHIALSHRTRQGEPGTAWYRGPLTAQPTVRTTALSGVLPLAHTGDQLRKVVPDGREDLSLAALFEIGRLLTFSKPTLVAALMAWRAVLFGAARARELADALNAAVVPGIGLGAAGGRDALENLVRTHLVGTLTGLPPGALAPAAQLVTDARLPAELVDLPAAQLLAGLGADPAAVAGAGQAYGVDGLGAVPVPVGQAATAPVQQDRAALAALSQKLQQRVSDLVMSALPGAGVPQFGTASGRSGGGDDLDRLIAEAEARRSAGRRPED